VNAKTGLAWITGTRKAKRLDQLAHALDATQVAPADLEKLAGSLVSVT
jgi:hypothetical protein